MFLTLENYICVCKRILPLVPWFIESHFFMYCFCVPQALALPHDLISKRSEGRDFPLFQGNSDW